MVLPCLIAALSEIRCFVSKSPYSASISPVPLCSLKYLPLSTLHSSHRLDSKSASPYQIITAAFLVSSSLRNGCRRRSR